MSTLETSTRVWKVHKIHQSQLRLSQHRGSRGGDPPVWNILRLVRLSDHDPSTYVSVAMCLFEARAKALVWFFRWISGYNEYTERVFSKLEFQRLQSLLGPEISHVKDIYQCRRFSWVAAWKNAWFKRTEMSGLVMSGGGLWQYISKFSCEARLRKEAMDTQCVLACTLSLCSTCNHPKLLFFPRWMKVNPLKMARIIRVKSVRAGRNFTKVLDTALSV